MRGFLRFALILVGAFALLGIGNAQASEIHGIVFLKGCASPVPVGDPYACQVQIANSVDSTHDTVQITGLSDVVNSAGGAITSGNILSSIGLVFSGAVLCTGGSGAGTAISPYVGATSCSIPFGASIESMPYSFYGVQPADMSLPNQQLTDDATLNWHNTCVPATRGCETVPRTQSSHGSAFIGTGNQSTDFHGIVFTKDCATPESVGSPHACSFQVLNTVDTAHDTLRITGLTDATHAASGEVNSGNILASLQLVFTGAVSCTGGSGAGTAATPYVGATACLLPFGASIQTLPFTYYTVEPLDLQLPDVLLRDTATLAWNNTCMFGSGGCTTDPRFEQAIASVEVVPAAFTFLGFEKPPADSYKAGKPIDLRFQVGDSAGNLLSDADARALVASCGVTAMLDGLAPVCASYVPGTDLFRVRLDTPKDLAAGQYPLTISVGGAIVDAETITITAR